MSSIIAAIAAIAARIAAKRDESHHRMNIGTEPA
jgi:hypothetical protein